MWLLLSIAVFLSVAEANYPIFDYRTRMRVLLLPTDLRPGSVIYRLRGTDAEFDYPLQFSVADDVGKSIIRIENMPCNPTHTYCQANVFLTRKLEPDRVYDLILSLKDATGRETKVDATIKATRATTHFEDIFPYVPNVIMVLENTKVGTVLDFVLARKNPGNSQRSYLELWGSEKFRIVQNVSTKDITNGSIVLTGELDFEEKTMYTLQVFCLVGGRLKGSPAAINMTCIRNTMCFQDPYTDTAEDTRNIAGFQLPVIVEDDQDMPPVFSSLPPVTKIKEKLEVGDKILKVQAQDGDRGNPRPIRYTLMTEGNPLSSFFNISEKSGEIFLARPLKDLSAAMRDNQPVILTVLAEEMKKNLWEPPAMTASTQVAFLLENDFSNTPPQFQSDQYTARIAENAPQGTALIFGEPYLTSVKDGNPGKDGVFSLSLENNNGTFEVTPAVGEGKANFMIRVRNNELLDFEERKYVTFTIVATEVTPPADGATPLASKADVTVYLDDQNDNPPRFLQEKYEAEIPENVTAGTVITQVQATDVDTGLYGKVFYTNVLGNVNQSLAIDSTSGVITVATNNHGFDRESAQEYRLMVEARDMEGLGNRATVPLVIRLLDVNDETPEFERQTFEFILQPNLRNFTSRAFVKAIDKDAEKPNNVVRYEIISGNYENKFFLNEITGELSIRNKLSNTNLRQTDDLYGPGEREESEFRNDAMSVIVLTVRAYDLGVPHRWTHAYVRIYPPESRARNMNFIVSGKNPDRKKTEELLRQLTGGRVTIQDIRPYTGQEIGTDLSWRDGLKGEKSVVSATVFYDGNSYVDLNQVEKKLTQNKTQAIVEATVTEYKNENRLLFWLLMFFLILMLLILLTLILCCIWQGCCICPWFEFDRKHIISPRENMKFILHERNNRQESKDIQAVNYYGRREAWSGRNHEKTFQYDSKPAKDKLIRQMKIESSDDYGAAGATYRSHTNETSNGGPNVIYTREFIRKEKERNPTMVIEDVETNPYTMKTTALKTNADDYHPSVRLAINSDNDPDSDSLRRHEVERGSDLDKSYRKSDESPEKGRISTGYPRHGQTVIKEYRLVLEPREDNQSNEEMDLDQGESNREQYYIRDGNAEILRLVTRGNEEERPEGAQEPEQAFIKLDRGKDIIMKKFMKDQKPSPSHFPEEFQHELFRRLQKEFEERNSDASYQNRSVISENVAHVRAANRMHHGFVDYNFQNQETQSLPGQMEISTQTEREFGTQTEELSNLRPPRRRVRSDNEFSEDDDDNEYKFDSEKAVEALDLGKGWVRRESQNFRTKKMKRYNMRTPILEEGESEAGIKYDTRPAMFKMPEFELIVNGTGSGAYTENKSSILRRRKMKEKFLDDERTGGNEENSSGDESVNPKATTKARRSRRDFMEDKKEMIRSTRNQRTESLNRLYEAVQELGERDLRKIRIETKQRAASLNRFYNALAAFEAETRDDIKKSTSLVSLKSQKEEKADVEPTRSSSAGSRKPEEKNEVAEAQEKPQETKTRETGSESTKSSLEQKENFGSSQSVEGMEKSFKGKKSKYMDWYEDLNKRKVKKKTKTKKKEDDLDSGIAMSSQVGSKSNDSHRLKTKSDQLLEKKSVFAIAYDGVRTKTIRPETNSSEKC